MLRPWWARGNPARDVPARTIERSCAQRTRAALGAWRPNAAAHREGRVGRVALVATERPGTAGGPQLVAAVVGAREPCAQRTRAYNRTALRANDPRRRNGLRGFHVGTLRREIPHQVRSLVFRSLISRSPICSVLSIDPIRITEFTHSSSKRFFPHRNLVSRLPAYPHGQGRSRKDFFRIIISLPRSPHAAPRTGCVPRPHANPVDPAAQRAGVPVGTEFPSEKKLWHVGPAFQARFCHSVLRWPRGSAPSLEGGGRLRKGCVPARPKISYALNSHFGGCLLGRILFHFHSYV